MDDKRIVELYWKRDERAIAETQSKYGRFCYAIAFNILRVREDAEECENDTYLDAWDSMPPERPAELSSFLGMLTRRRALDRYRYKRAQKRAEDVGLVPLCELEECLCSEKSIVDELAEKELAQALSDALQAGLAHHIAHSQNLQFHSRSSIRVFVIVYTKSVCLATDRKSEERP